MAAANDGGRVLLVKWSGKEYHVAYPPEGAVATVADLKRVISLATNVLPSRQKLLNVKVRGKTGFAPDEALLSSIELPPQISMMGTPEKAIEELLATKFQDEIIDDFDNIIGEVAVSVTENRDNLAKIQQRIATYQQKVINAPRENKKLLVLDVDYTLFDHRSPAERTIQLMRPFLHEFLTAVYPTYDIMIWSATGMDWIELKMKELGVDRNPNYKITAYFDYGAMITVVTERHGVTNTKPLQVIWGKYPGVYTAQNSLLVDDLGRNFVMAPKNGLKIPPFKHAFTDGRSDAVLPKLAQYLLNIAELNKSFETLDHANWQDGL
ncbi:Ubiquitin family protein [Pelomyxa schiedti]|nr:Ubiquitin family protein [Pelomyxa schiedti]